MNNQNVEKLTAEEIKNNRRIGKYNTLAFIGLFMAILPIPIIPTTLFFVFGLLMLIPISTLIAIVSIFLLFRNDENYVVPVITITINIITIASGLVMLYHW